MKNNTFTVNANLFKRSSAAIIDFIVFIILGLSLISFAIGPIYDNNFNTSALSEEFLALQKASYLYVESEDTNQVLLVDSANYPTVVYQYYSEFKPNKMMGEETSPFVFSNAWFNTTILQVEASDSLFELVNEDLNVLAVAKSTVTSADITTYYTDAYNKALLDLAQYAPYRALAVEINRFFIEILSIAFLISGILFYLIIPLLTKYTQTLGKLILGLSVVTKEGYTLALWQKVVRFVAIMVTFVLAIYTVFGSILISYTFMIFTKNYRSLHDFVSFTKVVDDKQSKIFTSETNLLSYEDNFNQLTSVN
jgi:uncharacterized RDD family membrane protein YckC